LLTWTEHFGFHSSTAEASGDEYSSINWSHTISSVHPIRSGNSLIYPELFSNTSETSIGYLSFLQSDALIKMHRMLAPFSNTLISENDPLIIEASEIMSSAAQEDSQYAETEQDVLDFDAQSNLDHEK